MKCSAFRITYLELSPRIMFNPLTNVVVTDMSPAAVTKFICKVLILSMFGPLLYGGQNLFLG